MPGIDSGVGVDVGRGVGEGVKVAVGVGVANNCPTLLQAANSNITVSRAIILNFFTTYSFQGANFVESQLSNLTL
jgi:hypothetical protein